MTRALRLGTSVLVLPQRDPILVAKHVTALDVLSGGRALLGIGVGWMQEQYRFLRSPFSHRGAMADEWIEVLRTLWSGVPASFHGRWIDFDDAVQLPRPVQKAGPPILVGGSSEAAIRRAARSGDAWHPHGTTAEGLAEGVARLRDLACGRPVGVVARLTVRIRDEIDPSAAAVSGPSDYLRDRLEAYRSAGADDFVLYFKHRSAEDLYRQLEVFAEAVLPAFSS